MFSCNVVYLIILSLAPHTDQVCVILSAVPLSLECISYPFLIGEKMLWSFSLSLDKMLNQQLCALLSTFI